jgi:hypothetical protein
MFLGLREDGAHMEQSTKSHALTNSQSSKAEEQVSSLAGNP